MIIKGAKVYTKEHKFEDKELVIKGDRIIKTALRASDEASCDNLSENDEVIDATGLLAIPGLVDIHFHGAVGHDFCDADMDGLKEIARYEADSGVLAICPATMTYSEEILTGIMDNARSFEAKDDEASLIGINMEGPFISPKRVGAQNPEYLMLPDADMFLRLQERSGGLIKLVDIAPELQGGLEFIQALSGEVNISIAHTVCDYDTASKAFKNGARHVTHLFNAMPGLSHREPGPIRAAMEKEAEVELIADGVHIHPSMVRFTFESFPKDKVILISDSMEATGLPDGEYQLGGQKVTVTGNRAVLSKDLETIAGSATNLFNCMKSAVKMGISREDAIRAATENPAKSIGIDSEFGSVEEGYFANILLVDESLEIKHIINRGKLIK